MAMNDREQLTADLILAITETKEPLMPDTKTEPRLAYRYRVIEVGGTAGWSLKEGDHLLEWDDRGLDTQWEVWNDTEHRVTAWAVGVLVDVVQVCPCGKALVTLDHDCDSGT